MALLTITALLLVVPSVAEVPHENYDRARLNLEIVHLFLEPAFRRAEAALAAAAEERLEEAEENLTLFRLAMESAMETLEKVDPKVPSYHLIEEEMRNISALYAPLIDVVGGLVDLYVNLQAYRNHTLSLPGALLSSKSLLENLSLPYDFYRGAISSLRRSEGGVEALKIALLNISSAYNTSAMTGNLTRVESLIRSTAVPPYLTVVLRPLALFFEEEMASSLIEITGGSQYPPYPEGHAASISGAYSASTPALRAELDRVFPHLLTEYNSLRDIISRLPRLYQLRENMSGPIYLRVSSYHESEVLLQEMEAGVSSMEASHIDLIGVGAGSDSMGEAIERVRAWLLRWEDNLTELLNLTGELQHLSLLLSRSAGGALWDYDRDGDGHLDAEEVLAGWSLQEQEWWTGEFLREVGEVRRAIANFTEVFPGEFLTTFSIEEEGSELCGEFLSQHRTFLQALEGALRSPTLQALEEAWGDYGALNTTYSGIVHLSGRLESAGYPPDPAALGRAERMLGEYYNLLINISLTLPEGLIIYPSKPSYPLGDSLVITGRAYMNGPLRGWEVNLTVFSENFTVKTGKDGAFAITLPIPLSTSPGRYTAEASVLNMSARCSFEVTLIPVRLTLHLSRLYAEPGENVSFKAVSEDLWGAEVNSTLLLDGEPLMNISGGVEGVVNLTEFGVHTLRLTFPGDPYHLPGATPYAHLNISLPLTLVLEASSTTLYRNSSINLTVRGAPAGRYVEITSTPRGLELRLLCTGDEVNVTLHWGELPPGEFILRAIYRAQDPVYRDAESNPVIIMVVDEEPPMAQEVTGKEEKEGTGGGGELNGNGSIQLPPIIPYDVSPPGGEDNLLLYVGVLLCAAALLLIFQYIHLRRSGSGPSQLTQHVEEAEEGGEEEEEPSQEVIVGVPLPSPGGPSEYYFRVLRWVMDRGVPVAEHHTPREMLRLYTEVEGPDEELKRFVEVFERYTYGPVKRDEDLHLMAALADRITGVGT